MLTTPQPAPRRLSVRTMIAFGLGQGGESLRTLGASTFLLFYYQQIIGLSGSLTALALSLSLIVDALIDPVVGALSDRTHTRWGRRHPFMIAGMLPLGVLFYATFNPPELSQAGYFGWLLATVVLTRISMSVYSVPYTALAAELAQDYTQRSTLFGYAIFFGTLATMLAPAVAMRVFFPTTPEYNPGLLDPAGYHGFALAFAIAMVVMTGASIVGTWRQIPYLSKVPSRHAFSLKRAAIDLKEAFRNHSFRVLFFGFLLASLMAATEGVFLPFMGPHFWGLTTEQISIFALTSLGGLVVSMPLMPIATRRFDKKNTLVASCLISLTAWHIPILLRLIDPPWFPANGSPWIMPILLASNFFVAAVSPLIFASLASMFADITDEHELEIGERREGTIFAARSLALQLIFSAGITMGGVVLDLIHFPSGARTGTVPADVLRNLGLVMLGAAALNGCGVMLYMRYRLDRKRHAEVLVELASRRASAAGSASAGTTEIAPTISAAG
jgi:glycoside/pentoside/hexuronide:cation symporter, GPH family